MKNKKGFTLLELLAVLIILGILMVLAYMGVSRYIRQTNDALYEDYEKNISTGATNYLIDHTGSVPVEPEEDEPPKSVLINVDKLICEGYIESLEDPKVDGATCNLESYAIVTRNVDSRAGNMDIEYKACLKCSNYESPACSDSISGIPVLEADPSCEVE